MLRRAVTVVFAGVVLSGCRGVPLAPSPPTSVTFARPPLVAEGRSRCATTLAIAVQEQLADGGVTESSELHTARFLFEPLALQDGRVAKARLTYEAKGSTTTRAGREEPRDPHVAGTSWVLDWTGELLGISGDGDPAVHTAERSSVAEEAWLLGGEPLRAALPSKPLAVGQRVPELAEAVNGLFRALTNADSDAPWLEGVEVTLAQVSPDSAQFAFVAHLSHLDAWMQMQGEFHGELDVRPSDARLTRFALSGRLTVAPREGAPGQYATASLSASFTRTEVPAGLDTPSPGR